MLEGMVYYLRSNARTRRLSERLPVLRRLAVHGVRVLAWLAYYLATGLRRSAWLRQRLNLPSGETVSWIDPNRPRPAGESVPVDLPRTVNYQLPIVLEGTPHASFLQAARGRTEGTYVTILPGGSFWGYYGGFTFDARGHLLHELARDNWYAPRPSAFTALRLPPRKRVAGTVATLCSPYAANSNYGHWLMDIVPQFGMLLRAGIKLEAVDRFVLPYAGHRYQAETLALLGIPEVKIIPADHRLHLTADRLVVPFITRDGSHITKEGCDFVRSLFLGATGKDSPGRLIYSSRYDVASRRVLNEAEVLAYLKTLGFEDLILSRMSVKEQARAIFDAKAVIGATGSNLTNIIFARAGSALIEIFSPGWVNRFQWYMCNHIGVRFAYLVSQDLRPSGANEMRYLTEDVMVDIDKLAKMCRLLGLA